MSKYFNENEFQYALDCVEKNPFEAKKRYDEYLDKYPQDYYARAYYILLLTRIGLFELAQQEYDYIEKMIIVNTSFSTSDKRAKGFKYIMALAKAKLLAHSEKYQELLDFYYKNQVLFESRGDTKYMSYYCRFKLGKIQSNSYNDDSPYRYLQVIRYDEDRFLNHIKKHQADYNTDSDDPNKSIFVPNFPIEKIVSEIKKYIPSEQKLEPALFDDIYYFKYDNCGRVNNKMTNYFTVVCFHNTCHFLTMCPANNCEFLPYIDLNYLHEKDDDSKVKRLSQIDKFNKRFNRN